MQARKWRRIWSDTVQDLDLALLTDAQERLFHRMRAVADDFGNLPGDPRQVFAACIAGADGWTVEKVAETCTALQERNLIHIYGENGAVFYHVTGFILSERFGELANRKRDQRCPSCPELEDPEIKQAYPDTNDDPSRAGAGARTGTNTCAGVDQIKSEQLNGKQTDQIRLARARERPTPTRLRMFLRVNLLTGLMPLTRLYGRNLS